MTRKKITCSSCGARISIMSNKCSKCGKVRVRKVTRKTYSGVRHQQGRVKMDEDWNENTQRSTKVGKLATTRCASCGSTNSRGSLRCKNCGASL
ncbi:MAG: hypothetical protein KAQ65_03990 [Candidatus Thorarchaeota archaeon]|nr:hypothetical protein [Candidatus Thorarchaeota archaeon]